MVFLKRNQATLENGTIAIIVVMLKKKKEEVRKDHVVIVLLMSCCLLQYKINITLEFEVFS